MNISPGALVWRGILSVIVGILAVVWPGITIGAFVILFAVYALLAACTAATAAFRSKKTTAVAGGALLALIDVAAGIAALVWPGITALSLVWVVAAWALVGGFAEIAMAFAAGETGGQRALLGLGGLVSIALAVVFAIRPDVGAETIAQVYGLFSIVAGVSALVMAANTRERPAAAYGATV